jgi:uncharacterized protein YecE (DUF72 family)
MTVYVGTSGWQYDHWRARFYPKDIPKARWLEYYAKRFSVVESNNAFYRLPKPQTFEDWARRTPDDFLFTVKVSRFLTHIKRLKDSEEPVERFLEHSRHLGAKLAPVLLQLPPTLRADLDALDSTLAHFGTKVRVSVEFRHPTWFTDECRALLEERGAALCLADGELGGEKAASRPVSPLWRTTDWGYVRFHHGAAAPAPCYGRTSLNSWARRVSELWGRSKDVFAFFNNDGRACALRDATTFAGYVRKQGLPVARVASSRDMWVS